MADYLFVHSNGPIFEDKMGTEIELTAMETFIVGIIRKKSSPSSCLIQSVAGGGYKGSVGKKIVPYGNLVGYVGLPHEKNARTAK